MPTRGQSLKCFTQRYVGQSCVLPKTKPCFANTQATVLSQHPTMFSLSGFCPNKNDVGPLLVLPAESVIWSIALDLDNQPTSVTVFSWMVESTATVKNLMHVDDHRFDQVSPKLTKP